MGLAITANRLNELYGVAIPKSTGNENEPAGNNINNINNINNVAQGAQDVKPGEARGELTRLMRSLAGESFSNVTQADLGKVKGGLSKSVFKKLDGLAKKVPGDLIALSKLTGADLAEASKATLKKINGMIDRQMSMSELFMDAANQLQGDENMTLRNQLFDMSLKCSSRASELGTLIVQMSAIKEQVAAQEAAKQQNQQAANQPNQVAQPNQQNQQVANQPNQVAQPNQANPQDPPGQQVTTAMKNRLFNQSVGSLMKGMAATMHGNESALNSEAAQDFGKKLVSLKREQKEVVSSKSLGDLKTLVGQAEKELSVNMDSSFRTAVENRLGKLKSVGASAASIAADNAFKRLGDPAFRKCMTDPHVLKHLSQHDSTGFLNLCSKFFLALDELSGAATPEQLEEANKAFKAVQDWLAENRLLDLTAVPANMNVEQFKKLQTDVLARQLKVSSDLLSLAKAIRSDEPPSKSLTASAKGVVDFSESLMARLKGQSPASMSQAEYLLALDRKAVSYTFAHVKEMLADGKNLADEQLTITGGDILSVVSAKSNLSIWLETRVHGVSPDVIDQRLVGYSRIYPDTQLGSGMTGSVVKFYVEKGETDAEIVFKPEINGRIGLTYLSSGQTDGYGKGYGGVKTINLNVAANKVADFFGFGHMLVKSGASVHNGTFGITMDLVQGDPAMKFTSNNSVSIYQLKTKDPDKLKNLQNSLLRQTTDMQWLDLLIGQGDRHWNNYMIDADFENGTAKVTGIDNDVTFPAYRTGLTKLMIDPKSFRGKRFNECFAKHCKGMNLTPEKQTKILDTYMKDFQEGGPCEIDLSDPSLPIVLKSALALTFGLHSAFGLPDYMSESMCAKLMEFGTPPELVDQKLEGLMNSLKPLLPAKQAEAAVGRFKEMIKIAKEYQEMRRVLSDNQWMDHLKELAHKGTYDRIADKEVKNFYLETTVCPAIRDCSNFFGVDY